jgi:quercetin dioxygenase-like cupin family protein
LKLKEVMMRLVKPALGATVVAVGLLFTTVHAGQVPEAATGKATIWSAQEGQWAPLPDILPPGGQMKVIHGDPAKGAATFYMRFPAGYVAPWHLHTSVETVLMDKGNMRIDVRGGQSEAVAEGGYIRIPARVPHTVTCTGSAECLMFLESSGPFDIYLVNHENWTVTKSWRARGMATPSHTR